MAEVLLTTAEVAERLRTTVRNLERKRVSGDGPAYVRLSPRQVRYRVSTVEEYAAAREYRHRAEELSRNPETAAG